jgi:hypothetical protein
MRSIFKIFVLNSFNRFKNDYPTAKNKIEINLNSYFGCLFMFEEGFLISKI